MNIAFRPEIVTREGAEDEWQAAAEETGEEGREEPREDGERDESHGNSKKVTDQGEDLLRPPLGTEIPGEGNEGGAKAGEEEDAQGKSFRGSPQGFLQAEADDPDQKESGGDDRGKGKGDEPAQEGWAGLELETFVDA